MKKKKKTITNFIDLGKIYPHILSYSIYGETKENYINITFSIFEMTDDKKSAITAEFSLGEDELNEIIERIMKLKGVK